MSFLAAVPFLPVYLCPIILIALVGAMLLLRGRSRAFHLCLFPALVVLLHWASVSFSFVRSALLHVYVFSAISFLVIVAIRKVAGSRSWPAAVIAIVALFVLAELCYIPLIARVPYVQGQLETQGSTS